MKRKELQEIFDKYFKNSEYSKNVKIVKLQDEIKAQKTIIESLQAEKEIINNKLGRELLREESLIKFVNAVTEALKDYIEEIR